LRIVGYESHILVVWHRDIALIAVLHSIYIAVVSVCFMSAVYYGGYKALPGNPEDPM
jgi:hypothetical protein